MQTMRFIHHNGGSTKFDSNAKWPISTNSMSLRAAVLDNYRQSQQRRRSEETTLELTAAQTSPKRVLSAFSFLRDGGAVQSLLTSCHSSWTSCGHWRALSFTSVVTAFVPLSLSVPWYPVLPLRLCMTLFLCAPSVIQFSLLTLLSCYMLYVTSLLASTIFAIGAMHFCFV